MNENDTVKLVRGDNSATIHLFGATLISWNFKGNELIFVSSKAVFDNKKAIRGGIPLVFPQFGPWDLGPQHGFARISRWQLERAPKEVDGGDVEAVFALCDDEGSRAMWNYKFKILYTVTLKEVGLSTEVQILNAGEETFSFTCLLHTYLKVPDVTQCLITGLTGCVYNDKIKGDSFTESRFHVAVSDSTDSVYKNTSSEHLVTNCAGGSNIKVIKENFPDTVIWNPWMENARKMADFGDDEYPRMLCVEAGCVTEPVSLAAKETFQAAQHLLVVDALV